MLLSLDPASMDLSKLGRPRTDAEFPLSWTKSFGKGRVFYTALGDWEETWKDERYRKHLLGGIDWALGASRGPKPR